MRLFICTDESDEALLDSLIEALDGYRMTIDIERLIPNRDNRPFLQAAIQDCEAFVFALTPNSLKNKRCSWEVQQAIALDRPILTIVLTPDVHVPALLQEHIIIDMYNDADSNETLLDALYVVGATPPSFLVQFFRNRLVLAIVVLIGFLMAYLLAGPSSPYRNTVGETLRGVIEVADRVDVRPTATPADPNAPDPFAPMLAQTQATIVESLVQQGQELARNGNYDDAITVYNRALDTAPNAVGVYIARGEALQAIGETDTAWGDFTRAIELAPNLALPYVSRADFFVRSGNPDSALNDINMALTIEPENPRAYLIRGQAYRQQGNYDAALTALNVALNLRTVYAEAYSERGEVYRLLGQVKNAQADFELAIQQNSLLGSAYYRRGLLWMSQNNPDAAFDDFTQALRANPNDGLARQQRADILLQRGDYAAAITDLNRAIGQDPDNVRLYLLRGSAHRCNADPALAVADFSRAADVNLDAAVGYLSVTRSYQCVGAIVPTVDAERIAVTDPNLDAAYVYVAEALALRAANREAMGDTVGAENDYTLAIALTPTYTRMAALYEQRGLFYERLNQLDKALSDYAASVNIVPERGRYHMNHGRLLAATGDIEAALRALDTAQELNPLLIEAFLTEGDIYFNTDDFASALDIYTRASFLDRDYPPTLARRVRALLALGDCSGASADIMTLEASTPDDVDTLAILPLYAAQCDTEQ